MHIERTPAFNRANGDSRAAGVVSRGGAAGGREAPRPRAIRVLVEQIGEGGSMSAAGVAA